jgi:hypothetical protein
MEDLVSVLYVSSMITNYSGVDIKYMVHGFREMNKEHRITGILLYSEGNVMQYIEGPKSEIDSLFSKIKSDVRHRSVITLLYDPIVERIFPQWSMTLKKIDLVTFNDIKSKEVQIIKNFMRYNMD